MNPLFKWGLVVSIAGLVLQLLWIVYFFGFFRGMFQEFKENVTASLKRLEAPYFSDVTVVRRNDAAGQHAFAAAAGAEHESQPVQRSKR